MLQLHHWLGCATVTLSATLPSPRNGYLGDFIYLVQQPGVAAED